MAADTNLYLATDDGVFRVAGDVAAGEPQSIGLTGRGRVRWILADAGDPDRVWAATERDGVWRTDDGGRHWAEKNHGLVYKHAMSLAQHPATGDLYVGTEPACIFTSTDGGESWRELESLRRLPTRKDWTFPGPPYVAHVRGIGLSASDPQIIFGAVEEGWLVRSTDGGDSWVNIKDGTEFDSHTVTILPDDPDVIVSASGAGLFRSTNGGDSFTDVTAGITHPYLINVAVHPDRPRVLFTAGAEVPPPGWRRPGGAGAGFYRSDDGGNSWRRLTGGLPERIEPAPRSVAVDPKAPDSVFFGLNDGEVWASRDGGEGFERLAGGLPPVLGIAPVSAA
jgi:photosystem II stability/assembly factor-like uncharacterized protein